MITFAVAPNQASEGGQLVYRRDEFSFDTEPGAGGRGISIVVNEVQLFVNDEGRVIYVSGYCPYQGWDQTLLSPPTYSRAGLIVVDLNPTSIPTGMAFGLNDVSSRWPAYVNPQGWVCIGDPADKGDQAVEFAPGSVAVLRGDRLLALWLHPVMLGDD
jgi:hypothetical protein